MPPLTNAAPSDAGAAGSAPAVTAAHVQQRLMLHMPDDVRSASMALIAVILSLYAMQRAKGGRRDRWSPANRPWLDAR